MTDVDANIRTLEATWLGWEGDGPRAIVRLRGDSWLGERPDIKPDTEIAVVWSEPIHPAEAAAGAFYVIRDLAKTSQMLWSDKDLADRFVRELADRGFEIVAKREICGFDTGGPEPCLRSPDHKGPC